MTFTEQDRLPGNPASRQDHKREHACRLSARLTFELYSPKSIHWNRNTEKYTTNIWNVVCLLDAVHISTKQRLLLMCDWKEELNDKKTEEKHFWHVADWRSESCEATAVKGIYRK